MEWTLFMICKPNAMQCNVMLYYVILCYIMFYYVMLCYVCTYIYIYIHTHTSLFLGPPKETLFLRRYSSIGTVRRSVLIVLATTCIVVLDSVCFAGARRGIGQVCERYPLVNVYIALNSYGKPPSRIGKSTISMGGKLT